MKNDEVMRTTEIEKINEALVVLRHFINLSAKLLPFLNELNTQKKLSHHDLRNRERIIKVYRNYEFDTISSRILLNSNVLDLIKESFEQLAEIDTQAGSTCKLDLFMNEYQRLSADWKYIDAN